MLQPDDVTREVGQVPEPADPGLSQAEVESRVASGRSNVNTNVKTKSIGQIFAEHTLTLFNFVNLAMVLLVLSTGQLRNLLFIWVVFANLGIGIFQEVRSKRIVDRLAILAARPVRVRREGVEQQVSVEDVVLDDLVLLRHGDQVPADATVVEGSASMNESLLTGESRPVEKHVGDDLMSGSFVDSGSLVARVTRVGAEGYAARINAEAKYVKRVSSEIMSTLGMIIQFATIALVPLGIGLYLRTRLGGQGYETSVLSTVAAVVGMIPQGLVLLTSTVLAIATARLAMRDVLVQQLYCIEALARVDVLCLDKTGTITTGAMEVERVTGRGELALDPGRIAEVNLAATSIVRANADDANETAKAILAHAEKSGVASAETSRAVPFSSARKYSGCVLADGRAYVMGAAQFVLGAEASSAEAELRSFGEQARVLVVASCGGFDPDGTVTGDVELLGFVSLRDEIRPTARQTLAFFQEQGVTLDVISGDDPATVSAIALAAGVPGAESYVDASTLETPEQIAEAVRRCRVFGRVTPQQKRELVRALKADGHTVAMTGDGVNDVLALKEADCSVAMAAGSDAARNVAEIVLVDNDFAHMPEVVAEGRRSINNLQRSASLFLVKTVFSAALALLCILCPPYPFLPIQMSLISLSIIGIPSFVLALEPNHERITGNFLANVLARSLPASAAIVFSVGLTIVARPILGYTPAQISTMCTLLTAVVGVMLIIRISMPVNPLRAGLIVFVVGIVVLGSTAFAWFFEMQSLTQPMWWYFLVVGIISIVLFNVSFGRSVRHASGDGRFVRFMRGMEERHGKSAV